MARAGIPACGHGRGSRALGSFGAWLGGVRLLAALTCKTLRLPFFDFSLSERLNLFLSWLRKLVLVRIFDFIFQARVSEGF